MPLTVNRMVVLQDDGKLTLDSLPFHAGDTVEVIMLPRASGTNQQECLRGSVITYKDPFAPVAEEAWEATK